MIRRIWRWLWRKKPADPVVRKEVLPSHPRARQYIVEAPAKIGASRVLMCKELPELNTPYRKDSPLICVSRTVRHISDNHWEVECVYDVDPNMGMEMR